MRGRRTVVRRGSRAGSKSLALAEGGRTSYLSWVASKLSAWGCSVWNRLVWFSSQDWRSLHELYKPDRATASSSLALRCCGDVGPEAGVRGPVSPTGCSDQVPVIHPSPPTHTPAEPRAKAREGAGPTTGPWALCLRSRGGRWQSSVSGSGPGKKVLFRPCPPLAVGS